MQALNIEQTQTSQVLRNIPGLYIGNMKFNFELLSYEHLVEPRATSGGLRYND